MTSPAMGNLMRRPTMLRKPRHAFLSLMVSSIPLLPSICLSFSLNLSPSPDFTQDILSHIHFFSGRFLEDRKPYINHKVRKDTITPSCSSFFFLTNPSTPSMVEWQASHIKLKTLNFFPLGLVVSPGAQ